MNETKSRPVTCKDVGVILRSVRSAKHLTLTDVARVSGDDLRWATVKLAETNPEELTLPLLLSVCRGLDIPIDQLMVLVVSRADDTSIGVNLDVFGVSRILRHLDRKYHTPKAKRLRSEAESRRVSPVSDQSRHSLR